MPNTFNFSVQIPDSITAPSASTPTLTIEHMAYRPRRLRRRDHSTDRVKLYSGVLRAFAPNSPIPLPTAPQFYSIAMPGFYGDPKRDAELIEFEFMHWIVSGITSVVGPITNKSPIIQGEDTNIVATAWYGGYGIGGGPNAIILDCYDYDLGKYVDDDFVTVNPPDLLPPDLLPPGELPEKSATIDANNGIIVTGDKWLPNIQVCNILAFDSVGSGAFLLWDLTFILSPTITIESNSPSTLDVSRNAEAIAHAWYKRPAEVDPCLALDIQIIALRNQVRRLGNSQSAEAIELRRRLHALSEQARLLNCDPIVV